NDGAGGPKIDEPAWKRPVWRTFRNNFVNPSYGGGEENPGCWFSCKIADVEFFLTDGRYYRSRKTGSMLGPVQKKWLLDALKKSTATFKVLCVNVPMTPGVKPGSKDTWDGFPEERKEIFDWIARHKIEGVFVIAADRHRSDAWKNERPGAYPIYEFQSSRLTNVHTHRVLNGSIFGYNAKCSFGLLRFDTAAADPSVTYEIINIDNKKVHSLIIRRSELGFKSSTNR
ncbi:MAG: alkaline phosphatase D family protein, partial [Phycisphaeraceae bacterium]|nr:alkaline phosphatase D family protein [Phycisphaeraceae bacterium]